MLGAAEDRSVKVLIVASIIIFQQRNPRLTHTCRPVYGRASEGPHDLPRSWTRKASSPRSTHGDAPDIHLTRDVLRQLVDSKNFSESLHFAFNERNITKTTALGNLDAVRHCNGLMDHVDLPGLANAS